MIPRRKQGHAIVLGASMAGLGAACALARHFERVTVIERDVTATAADVARKGVPQGQHAHVLLPAGHRVLAHYLPGIIDELVRDGALAGDMGGSYAYHAHGATKLRAGIGIDSLSATRPFLERHVRDRVRALPGVTLLEGHDTVEALFDHGAERVHGVVVRNRTSGESRTIDGDLVVDATGRGSVAPRWLASWGFGAVSETEVKVSVGYATAVFERRPGDLEGLHGALVAGTPPGSKRLAAVLGVEGDRWIVTLSGSLRDHPPGDLAGWRAFAAGLPAGLVQRLVVGREPLQPITTYRYPATRHRHFERMARFPAGFLVLGDAFSSFNPIYGQGMSVALLQARALEDCLERGRARLAKRFFARAASIVEGPWAITTGEDFRHPEVAGRRPPGFEIVSRYMERAHRAAAKDPVVLERLLAVFGLIAPPLAILRPDIAWRVMWNGRAQRRAPEPIPGMVGSSHPA